jgi:hypothetical protein
VLIGILVGIVIERVHATISGLVGT